MSWPFLAPSADGVRIQIHAQPNARRSEICGSHGEALKVKIKAPPESGQANTELIDLFSKILRVPKKQVELVSGVTSRRKVLLVRNLDLSEVVCRLGL